MDNKVESVIYNCTIEILERALSAKQQEDNSFKDGMMLAYSSVLSILKRNLYHRDDEEASRYGLDFDIDKEMQ